MAVAIVVEVSPHSLRAAALDAGNPFSEFLFCIIVAVPAGAAMETDVNVVGGFDQFVGQARAAGGAEYDLCFSESLEHF